MIVTSQASAESTIFYQRRAEYLLNIAKKRKLYKIDISGVRELERLLEIESIKAIYVTICQTDAHMISDAEYNEAIRHFCSKMFLTDLKGSLLIYGITLTSKQVIIDSSEPNLEEHYEILLKAYRILILMHEFAHFLMRASTRTFSEFIRFSTPSARGHPPTPLTMTRTRRIIQDNFPIDYHGEAGTIFEERGS